jgi:hypothetical protein
MSAARQSRNRRWSAAVPSRSRLDSARAGGTLERPSPFVAAAAGDSRAPMPHESCSQPASKSAYCSAAWQSRNQYPRPRKPQRRDGRRDFQPESFLCGLRASAVPFHAPQLKRRGLAKPDARATREAPPPHESWKHPTSNIERPTSNHCAHSGLWMFDVGCWVFRGREKTKGPVRGYARQHCQGWEYLKMLPPSGTIRRWTQTRIALPISSIT